MKKHLQFYTTCLLALIAFSCTSTNKLSTLDAENLSAVKTPLSQIIAEIPNYKGQLISAKGNGRAIVSEPGNSDRVTIDFETDTTVSLLTFKNRIGINGGSMLVDADSILIYNRIDKYAQKISINERGLTSLNELASVNLLNLMNYKVYENDVKNVLQSTDEYVLFLKNKGMVRINKKDGTVKYIEQIPSSGLPYSSIRYENYGEINGYKLPRKITIFSSDQKSKVVFQIRSLIVNPDSIQLSIEIPEKIVIQRL